MSGGSFEYLWTTHPPEMLDRIETLESMERLLRRHDKLDMALEVGNYVFELKRMRREIILLHEKYQGLLEAVELWNDDDVGLWKLEEVWQEFENRDNRLWE